ncbi:hypothetical protein [Gluconobacter sp. Gdi]|uniref:hypothetical protein n=1 Tax=Gluconobacter sp. Gdi TaxID=2691888 RepID=UPI00176667DC|nr:hypothetical protein [Gluconobacter sp. Gdi]GFE97858.1 hypothetical protein DmGdi_29310 [Gluconobacter sp. Gdi]
MSDQRAKGTSATEPHQIKEWMRRAKDRDKRLALAGYRQRAKRNVSILVHDVEPQSKKMPDADRDRFQAEVSENMATFSREPFTGPIALQVDLTTTRRNAPQAHTIAKNLLDLLGTRRPKIPGKRRHLLYKDDAQIQALSVRCQHGQEDPAIHIIGRPLSALLDDLELAIEAIRVDEMENYGNVYGQECEQYWIDELRRLKRHEKQQRARLGDEMYDAYFKLVRWSAQRSLFGRCGIDLPVLGWMYGRPKEANSILPPEEWARLIGQSKLRLQLGDLPIKPGSSEAFKIRVGETISAFKKRWDWIISPLVVPVALEVVVRPNASTPAAVLHDLDNIVRDYLLPSIVPSFGTVTDHRWTINFAELRRLDPDLANRWGPNSTPPPSTKHGVTRYEAWRLPPVKGEAGFVSVALVADMDARGDSSFDRIDEWARKWADAQ